MRWGSKYWGSKNRSEFGPFHSQFQARLLWPLFVAFSAGIAWPVRAQSQIQTPAQTSALALEPVTCLEIDREDLRNLLHKKPDAGMDMLAVLGKQFHAAQRLVQSRSLRNPNEIYEQSATLGDRVADIVAQFGGSWRFIIAFFTTLVIYTAYNVLLGGRAWDPYPFILLNLFLSMLAAIQAPVIMMSQNRQDMKDRLRGDMDFEVNRRAELEIRGLSLKLHQLSDKLDDVERHLRVESSGRLPK